MCIRRETGGKARLSYFSLFIDFLFHSESF
jgi:hypothetical protein